jgi:hypothetical protein
MFISNILLIALTILAASGVVFFIMGMYVGIKYTNSLQPTQKSIKLNVIYSLLGTFSLGLSIWLFLIVENGFSMEPLILIIGGSIVISAMVILNGFISSFFAAKKK